MQYKNITLLARSLECGGAERQLVELAKGLHNLKVNVIVGTLYSGGKLEADLKSAGIPVYSLNKKGRWEVIPFFVRFCKFIRSSNTQLIYAFLNIQCILAVLVRLVQPDLRIVWGVRASNLDLSRYDWMARFAYRVECRLSRFADLIIANSNAGRAYALANGFPEAGTIVIPNGIDTDRFKPEPIARCKLRAEWGVRDNEILIGIVARLDPMKDHPVFFHAASELLQQDIEVRFICVGDGNEPYRTELYALAEKSGLGNKLIWAGSRDDMTAVYNALDILVSSSYTEGFSNVIAEGMACGIPCVVTDVGDSKWIVGDTGIVVSPGDPQALAQACQTMITRIRKLQPSLGGKTRRRIIEQFGLDILTRRTEAAFATMD